MDVQVGKEVSQITCTRVASRLKALLLVRYTPSDIVLLISIHPECMHVIYLYAEAQHFSTVHKNAVDLAAHNNNIICFKVTYFHNRFISDFTNILLL